MNSFLSVSPTIYWHFQLALKASQVIIMTVVITTIDTTINIIQTVIVVAIVIVITIVTIAAVARSYDPPNRATERSRTKLHGRDLVPFIPDFQVARRADATRSGPHHEECQEPGHPCNKSYADSSRLVGFKLFESSKVQQKISVCGKSMMSSQVISSSGQNDIRPIGATVQSWTVDVPRLSRRQQVPKEIATHPTSLLSAALLWRLHSLVAPTPASPGVARRLALLGAAHRPTSHSVSRHRSVLL